MKIKDFVKFMASDSKTQFANLTGYKNSKGEAHDYNLVINYNYSELLAKSLVKLARLVPENEEQSVAKKELMESIQNSMVTYDSSLQSVRDDDGNLAKALKQNAKGDIYLFGLVVNKTSKDKEPKTIKDKMMSSLPISKIRQFKVTDNDIGKISVNKRKITKLK